MTLPLEQPRDPWSPRPIDLPRAVPLRGPLDALDDAKILAAPDDPTDWPAWRDSITRWRAEAAERIEYDGSSYESPELMWGRRCFTVALAWLWDEALYDHAAGRFTPERFLDDGVEQFGGYDGVVLWHAYPVIGIDERNQFDWYRDVPGIRELVDALHAQDVRVFLDYNPWDVGTRREPTGDAEATGDLVRRLDADGVFLDTMKEALPGSARPSTQLAAACASRASPPCRSPGSTTTTSPGRNGSPTAASRACCARDGSSSATCCTTRDAGTATIPRSSEARG